MSKFFKSGYWTVNQIMVSDAVGNKRYENNNTFGLKLFLDNPLEDLLQSVEAIQIAYAQALLVDREALEAAREANDVVRCQEILQAVFRTDVRALVAQARLELGGALDPIALFRQEKLRDQLIKARGAKTVATGL